MNVRWMNGMMDKCKMDEWYDEWMYEWLVDLNGWIVWWMNEWLVGLMNEWIAGWFDGLMNGWLVWWMNEWLVGLMNEWMAGGFDGLMNSWMVWWMNGWMDWSPKTELGLINTWGQTGSISCQYTIYRYRMISYSWPCVSTCPVYATSLIALTGFFHSTRTTRSCLFMLNI